MAGVHDLNENWIHLGLGATSVVEPEFAGDPSWYMGYAERHASDGVEGRLVAMHSFDGAWAEWEMHPHGTEIVLCISGTLEVVQQIGGDDVVTRLAPGEYVINEPGVWHTANDTGPCTALFITAGAGTKGRPRE